MEKQVDQDKALLRNQLHVGVRTIGTGHSGRLFWLCYWRVCNFPTLSLFCSAFFSSLFTWQAPSSSDGWINVRSDFKSIDWLKLISEGCNLLFQLEWKSVFRMVSEGQEQEPADVGVGGVTNSTVHPNSSVRKQQLEARLLMDLVQAKLAGSPWPFCYSQQCAAQGNCLPCLYLELAVKTHCY